MSMLRRLNMRLKLPGGDRSRGSGVFAPCRARTFVHYCCAHGRVARSARSVKAAATDPNDAIKTL